MTVICIQCMFKATAPISPAVMIGRFNQGEVKRYNDRLKSKSIERASVPDDVKKFNSRVELGDLINIYYRNPSARQPKGDRWWFTDATARNEHEEKHLGFWAAGRGNEYDLEAAHGNKDLHFFFVTNMPGYLKRSLLALLDPKLDPSIVADPEDSNFDPNNHYNVIVRKKWYVSWGRIFLDVMERTGETEEEVRARLREQGVENFRWNELKPYIWLKQDHQTDERPITESDLTQ